MAANGPGKQTVVVPFDSRTSRSNSSSSLFIAKSRVDEDFCSSLQIREREAAVAQRKLDREQHHYKQIWTKDAHGGPYRKCNTDPEPANKIEPGYERPQSGPTTNFVGNHMTQGAIDLVQMELQEVDPQAQLARLRDYCTKFRPPTLLPKGGLPLLPATATEERAADEKNSLQTIADRPEQESGALREALVSDPARLRRALIEQRRGKTQGDGLLFQPLVDAKHTEGPEQRHTNVENDPSTYGSAQAALAAAKHAQAAGSFAEAVVAYDAAKRLHVESGDNPELIQCLLERARCSIEVGSVHQAADDCSEAILLAMEHRAEPSDSVLLAGAHLLRGHIFEQLERYVASCEDYRLARGLGCLQASGALARVKAAIKQQPNESKPSNGSAFLLPALPRASPVRFPRKPMLA